MSKKIVGTVIAVLLLLAVGYALVRFSTPGYVRREVADKTALCRQKGYTAYDVDHDRCVAPGDPDAPASAWPG